MYGPRDQTEGRVGLLCITVISHHKVWLREDPPELLGLHILRVTRDGFQYLVKKRKHEEKEVWISRMLTINNKYEYVTAQCPILFLSVCYLIALPRKFFLVRITHCLGLNQVIKY